MKKEKSRECDDFDEKAHSSLLEEIKKLNSNARIGAEKVVRVSSEAAQVIDKNEILKRIGDTALVKKIKTQKSLPKPLEKPQAKRLKRAVGYEEVATDANKWGGIVRQRRKADQLKFPIEEVDVRVITTEKNFKPPLQSDLEKEIYPLLYGAKLIEEKKQETEEEIAVKRAMSLQEVKERSKIIWQKKLLRQRLEKKAARLNKSKSRKFHKILRREKLKKKKDEFDQLKEKDPEKALEILNEIEKSRIQERMDLRHKNSKWLYLQNDRASRDKNVLQLLRENKEICNEILEKVKDPQNCQDDKDGQNSDDEFQINETTELSEKNKAHEDMDEDEQREDFVKFQSQTTKLQMDASSKQTSSSKEASSQGTSCNKDDEEDTGQSFLETKISKSRCLGSARVQDPAMIRGFCEYGSDDEDNEDRTIGNFEDIYGDDELIKEFQMEKQKQEEEKAKLLEDTSTLKGWGSWTGPGIIANPQKSKRKRRVLRTNPEMKPTNAYSKKPHVIYNESSDVHKNIRKHMVSELPYPFARVKDFEASIRQSVGRKFVPEISHKMLIAPPVVKKVGVVINPINEDALLKMHEKHQKRVSKVEKQLNEKLNPKLQRKHQQRGKRKKHNKNSSLKTLVIHK